MNDLTDIADLTGLPFNVMHSVDPLNFNLSNKRLFLTYRSFLDKKNYYEWLNNKSKIKSVHISHETGATSYEHTHVVVDFDKRLQTIKSNILDYNDIHPHICKIGATLDDWKTVVRYVKKNDENCFSSEAVVEDLNKNFLDDCWKHKNVSEAVYSEAKKYSDINGIKRGFALKPKNNENLKNYEKIDLNYPWQIELLEILKGEPDDRTIIWIYDPEGNTGKTIFYNYLKTKYPSEYAGVRDIGDAKDFASNVKTIVNKGWVNQKGFFFDLRRSKSIEVNLYNALGDIKDGEITVTKYKGDNITINSPHVIVFSNSLPDVGKLSKDRWDIREIMKDKTFKKIDVTRVAEYSDVDNCISP